MLIYFGIFIVLVLLSIRKIYIKDENKDYLSRENTLIVNGIFVILVFFSHFYSYYTESKFMDSIPQIILGKIGQLMVTTFLFFSGYGIYESIKSKGKKYVDSFFKRRFLPTFLNFAIAVTIFYIFNLISGIKYDVRTNILAYTGWTSIGNSNWYMLAIFSIYFFVMIAFNIFKSDTKNNKRNSLILITIFSVLYLILINIVKDRWYVDTFLCFVCGMWYSYFKEKIDKIFEKPIKYYIFVFLIALSFLTMYIVNIKIFSYNVYMHNIVSILFVVMICFILKKIKLENRILEFFGKNIFWIYILQRLPMMALKGKLNIYINFVICFIITIGLAVIMQKLTDCLWKKLKS